MPHFDCVVVGLGYTGRRVLAALPAGRAAGLSRRDTGGVGGRPAFVVDLDGPAAIPASADTVLYTVPPARLDGPDPRLRHLLDGLPRPPSRFVYLSTSGVYGDRGGEPVDETAAPSPTTARARRRVDAEQRLAAWSHETGADLVILRVPGIYGPGRLGLERLRAGRAVIREEEAHPGNRIHVADLVRAAVAATGDCPAGIYNVGDGDHRSATWFTRTVAELAGLPAPREIPRAEAARTFGARRYSFLEDSRRVDTRRMREVLGVTPRYADAADGIRAALSGETDE